MTIFFWLPPLAMVSFRQKLCSLPTKNCKNVGWYSISTDIRQLWMCKKIQKANKWKRAKASCKTEQLGRKKRYWISKAVREESQGTEQHEEEMERVQNNIEIMNDKKRRLDNEVSELFFINEGFEEEFVWKRHKNDL